MMRQALRGVLILTALVLLIEVSRGQQATPGKVYVREKDGSVKPHPGELKFGPGGFQIVKSGGKVESIAPDALMKFEPGELPGLKRGIVLNLITTEEKGTKADYEQALAGYTDLRKEAKASGSDESRRYVDYKFALMTTKVADESGDDERWRELAEAAVKAWGGFISDYPTHWEVWPATQTQARLLAELNRYEELARLWTRIAKTPELPANLKLEASLRAIDAEIRSGGFATASVSAEALEKTTAPGAAQEKLAIYRIAAKAGSDRDYAGAIKKIESAIAATKDAAVRGVGYGMIGELHLLAGKPREAMWAFLWVETVFNQDRADVMKAMCRLVDVFRAQGDEDRAKSYREKIGRYREVF